MLSKLSYGFLRQSGTAVIRLSFVTMVAMAVLGCRSSHPLSSMVQVTEDPEALVAEIDSPELRLATTSTSAAAAKPGIPPIQVAGAPKPATGEPTVGMPAVFQNSPDATSNAQASKVQTNSLVKPLVTRVESAEKTDQDTGIEISAGGLVSASLTDLSTPESKVAGERPQTKASAPDAPVQSAATGSDDSVEPAAETLVHSTEKQRPTVRDPNIAHTEQPHALTGALQNSLAQLPELPNADAVPSSGKSPHRIGTASPTYSASVPVGDLVATATEEIALPRNEALPPPPATQKSAVDEELSVAINANQVLPASHTVQNGSIETAGHQLESLVHRSDLPEEDPKPIAGVGKRSAESLTEAELYRELLDRISNAQPNESPLQRERRQIVMRHLMVLSGDLDQAIDSMEGLNPTEQSYLQNQLMGLWTMIDPQGHPSSGRRITEALPKFREATRHMAIATDSLTLENLEFCTEIESYGQIKPFEGNRFAAGQQVILYCEVENFAAEERSGAFQTQLQGSYDIYDSSGTKVISQLLPVDQQRSRNRLRDYFVAYQMNLPKGLMRGTYRLQLTLEDAVGKKYGQANIPFEIN